MVTVKDSETVCVAFAGAQSHICSSEIQRVLQAKRVVAAGFCWFV